MARNKIQSVTDQRSFIIVYNDFLESTILTSYEKIVFIVLKKFADNKNRCFPSLSKISKNSGLSKRKVQNIIKSLEEKKIISVKKRKKEDGGLTSNLYVLHDLKEIWTAESSQEIESIVDEYEENKIIEMLKNKGYTVTKEKEPIPTAPTKVSADISPQNNQFGNDDNTSKKQKSQEIERYNINQIKEIFEYDIMTERNPLYKSEIDNVISILYDAINSTKQTIRVAGEDKPAITVIAKLLKLNYESIMYAIHKFNENNVKVNNPISYMLTVLYKAQEQYQLEIKNQVNIDQFTPT